MIGRLGRSLQVHLLLASQRLEENKLRGLDSHLSYRIGLSTFSANESRAGARHHRRVPPAQPARRRLSEDRRGGSAALQRRPTSPARMSAPARSGPASPRHGRIVGRHRDRVHRRARRVPAAGDRSGSNCRVRAAHSPNRAGPENGGRNVSLLTRGGRRGSAGHGRPAHEVWLPPLDDSPTVDMLLPDPTGAHPPTGTVSCGCRSASSTSPTNSAATC